MLKKFFHKIKKILFYKKYSFLRNLRLFFNIDQNIKIGGNKLILPPGHLLSLYNAQYHDYDLFLPTLIRNVKHNESIIDIGANVGDTLLRCINANNKPNYYSIEADEYFFRYLEKNKKLFENVIQQKITLIKELVGQNLKGNLSITTSGTKCLIESSNGIKTRPLDEIIKDYKIENLKLIKVDVDGYDYNVLLSGINSIKKYKPDLFFEYMDLNKASYVELIDDLFKIGYLSWTVLDGYGSLIFENQSYKEVINLINLGKINYPVIDIHCKTN